MARPKPRRTRNGPTMPAAVQSVSALPQPANLVRIHHLQPPVWVTQVARQVNPYLLLALGLALVYHGSLLVSGTFKHTYDAYVHIFFADHYVRSWFDPWDYRWYTGFTLT